MMLSPFVQAILILDIVFIFFAFITLVLSAKIFFSWDINSTLKKQYKLEKSSFLSATIIKYIFLLKLPLFLFFIFTLDSISNVLTGAMCAAGVVDATPYGIYLLIVKVLNIYLFGFWLVLHKFDSKYETMPYTKVKFGFFILLFFILMLEIILEFLMFSDIDIDKMVSCCGVLYSSVASSSFFDIFSIDKSLLVWMFYINFLLITIFYLFKKVYFYAIFNITFLYIAILSLISFFGTYIYELPTHNCPFCFLQKDYYYIGYVIYITLFIGTFSSFVVLMNNFLTKDKEISKFYYKMSMIFITIYVTIVSLYPIIYYIKNGVWL
jgi:hypothetical protein